jgi:hypothetical protein
MARLAGRGRLAALKAVAKAKILNPSALEADAAGVVFRARMSALAVCMRRFSATAILLSRYRFKVVGVDAARLTTEMVNLVAIWNRAPAHFIGDAVSLTDAASKPEEAVPVPVVTLRSGPLPAAIFTNEDLRTEPRTEKNAILLTASHCRAPLGP